MRAMFKGAKAFNQNIGLWDVKNVFDMKDMFYGATVFDQNIGLWDISNASELAGMFDAATLSPVNYDALLIGWSNLPVRSNLTLHMGNSKYSSLSSSARAFLIEHFNWQIIDSGITEEAF